MRSNEYLFLLEWLFKEPNVDLIVPHIKQVLGQLQPAISTDLRREEINWLRKRVVMIKEKGHKEYSCNLVQATLDAEEVFEGVKVI